MSANDETKADAELTITRLLDAPREHVFAAWTEPEHLNRWCCPAGMTIAVAEGDISEGGWFRTCMRSADDKDYWVSGVYREMRAPARLVFTHAWEDENGERGHETMVTITLEGIDDGKRTRLTLHQAFFTSKESRDGHKRGWISTIDQLENHLPKLAVAQGNAGF